VLDAWRKTSLFRIYYSASPSLGQAQNLLKGSESLDATAFREIAVSAGR
jgi:predicted alpha/beta superfamily hydrolase